MKLLAILLLGIFVSSLAVAGPGKGNYNLLLGAQGGYLHFQGVGINTINARLYDTPLLDVGKTFQETLEYGAELFIFDRFSNFGAGVSTFFGSDKISKSASSTSLSSSLNFVGIGASLGMRLLPFARQSFRFAGTKPSNWYKRFMFFSYLKGDVLFFKHSFSREIIFSSTTLDYNFTSVHLTESIGARVYFAAGSKIAFFLDTSYAISQGKRVETTLNTFTVASEDLKYRGSELNLSSSASSSLHLYHLILGISFFL